MLDGKQQVILRLENVKLNTSTSTEKGYVMTRKEERVLKQELDKFLKILECKLDLTGITSKERYRWDKEMILDEMRAQIGEAIDIGGE